jgi:hypothetical protein
LMGFPYFLRLEDFYHNRFSTGLDQLRPSGRIGETMGQVSTCTVSS